MGTSLLPDDRLRIEFYSVTKKKDRKKLNSIFDIILQSLIEQTFIDIKNENLSDVNNYLINSTIEIKLYYTSPNIDREKSVLNATTTNEQEAFTDWNAAFDDEGRRGGHKQRHVISKMDSDL